MKKILTTIFVLLSLLSVSFGQKYQIGIHGGLGETQLSNQKYHEEKYIGDAPLVRWNAGLNFTAKIYNRLFIESECNLSRKGAVYYDLIRDFTYISLAASLRINLRKNNNKTLQPYTKIGAYQAYLISSNIMSNGERLNNLQNLYYIEFKEPNDLDFGGKIAFGLDYKVSPRIVISIETSFEQGIRDIYCSDFSCRNSNYNLATWGKVGLKFNL
jgi:hypothetical protein